MITTIEAMVPVRLAEESKRATGARFDLLLETLSQHWADPAPLRLTVVGLREELPMLRRMAGARPGLELRFLDEREMIDDPRFLALAGWFKQMFLKLSFCRFCEADAYLYLDADVVCVRPLSRAHLISKGRAVIGWEPKDTHPGWWEGAGRVLRRQPSDGDWGLAVTPNVLIADIAASALTAVGAAYGAEPLDVLLAGTGDAEHCWTENTVYGEAAEASGELEQRHTPLGYPSPYHSTADLWSVEQLDAWRPLDVLAARPATRFVVVQSNVGLDPAYIRKRLAPFVRAAPEATATQA